MTIETTKQVTSKVEVPVPSFWKSLAVYAAILNEHTAISFFTTGDYTNIVHGKPEELRVTIRAAYDSYDICTEQEFMEAYSKVLKSLSLQPELI